MKAYIIKDNTNFPVASTFFEPQAIKYCNENTGCSYILLPFLLDEETEIHMIAGPIDKKYFPVNTFYYVCIEGEENNEIAKLLITPNCDEIQVWESFKYFFLGIESDGEVNNPIMIRLIKVVNDNEVNLKSFISSESMIQKYIDKLQSSRMDCDPNYIYRNFPEFSINVNNYFYKNSGINEKFNKLIDFLKQLPQEKLFSFYCNNCIEEKPESFYYHDTGVCLKCNQTNDLSNPHINAFLKDNNIDMQFLFENDWEVYNRFHSFLLPNKEEMIQKLKSLK